ncbi:MAG TPA: hypothetical protein VD931_21290 [Baekduia sp.]|nr:hypothetical protein [Baekduia sp.]
MTRRRTGVALAIPAAAALAVGAASANEQGGSAQDQGVKGEFSLIQMIHTNSSTYGDLPGAVPWGGSERGGPFTYRGIPCTGNAPVNNLASDLPSYGMRVRGSRAPSSMRAHPFSFQVRRTRSGAVRMVGSITFTVCHLRPGPTPSNDPVPDAQKSKIRVGFSAKFRKENAELARWSGRFRIVGGTGRYDDLTGSGTISGYFFCFAPQGCTALGGQLRDGQFAMEGFYRDPTPDLAAG